MLGGQGKLGFFKGVHSIITVDNNPLNVMINELQEYFSMRYSREKYKDGGEEIRKLFSSPEQFLKIIDKALESEGWPDANKVDRLSIRLAAFSKKRRREEGDDDDDDDNVSLNPSKRSRRSFNSSVRNDFKTLSFIDFNSESAN